MQAHTYIYLFTVGAKETQVVLREVCLLAARKTSVVYRNGKNPTPTYKHWNAQQLLQHIH